MKEPILFPKFREYFAGILELENNVYEPCFLIKQSIDPIYLEIQFHAWFYVRPKPATIEFKVSSPVVEWGPDPKHMFHGWRFTEQALMEIDTLEALNQHFNIMSIIADRINWILKGVEMNADNLIGWQFDREYTKMMVEQYKAVPPPQIGDKPVKKRKKK